MAKMSVSVVQNEDGSWRIDFGTERGVGRITIDTTDDLAAFGKIINDAVAAAR